MPSPTHRIAIITDFPNLDSERTQQPLEGYEGRLLAGRLSTAGISLTSCYIGYVSAFRPHGSDAINLSWTGPEVTSSLAQLRTDLLTFQPNVILLLGPLALKACMDPLRDHKLLPKAYTHKISNLRGSIFQCIELNSPFYGFKVLPTHHPRDVLRIYEDLPLFNFDLKKVAFQGQFPDVRCRPRSLTVSTSVDEICCNLDFYNQQTDPVALDIEGYVDAMTCISFARSPETSFIVPFTNGLGGNFWSEEDELRIWTSLIPLLTNNKVPKVLQNSLYDRFVLRYSYGINVLGVTEDTMLKHWELYCELEKNLGVQCSIYTDVAYYKSERKIADQQTHWRYCCKDSCVTHEIATRVHQALLPHPRSLDHYYLNVLLLNPLLYMELRGIKYNHPEALRRKQEVETLLRAGQHQLDQLTGHGLGTKTREELTLHVRSTFCYKRDSSQFKKDYITSGPQMLDLINTPDRTFAQNGHLSSLLELSLNPESPKQLADYLYTKLRLPIQTGKDDQVTTDESALLNLRKITPKGSPSNLIVSQLITLRRLSTHAQMLSIHPDADGRIRCGYNIVGTETGRLTCYTSPTGSGYNLQTIPSEDRDLFLADDDHWFFQIDLAGADGWTVAAHSAYLGDPTMLDDLKAGIKPARVLCLAMRGETEYLNPDMPRDLVIEGCKKVKKSDWDYFACKIGQHGTCYLMGHILLSKQIFKQSDGEVYLPPHETKELQRLWFVRYRGVKLWHNSTQTLLSRSPIMTSPSGHRRIFFGRHTETLGQALAHEPQANTTYATNLAIRKLWLDPANRNGTKLIIQPLHQVHDALCGQFPKSLTSWAIPQLKSYFTNPMIIANQKINITFEGGYGPSWGDQSEGSF